MKKQMFAAISLLLISVLTVLPCAAETDTASFPSAEAASLVNGDMLFFGSYEQDNNLENGAEPLEWIVLKNDENRLTLITRLGIDVQPYNEAFDKVDTTWEECSLRVWLNGAFYETAFSDEERAMIQRTNIVNDDNTLMRTIGGNDTTDYVFCLSISEASELFANDEARKTYATPYAVANGAATEERNGGTSRTWLRSPGNYNYRGALILGNGTVSAGGFCANGVNTPVRPVIVVAY